MSRNVKRHSADIKYVREVIGRGATRGSGIPSALVERIVSGAVDTISHAVFKKFRSAYDREVYRIQREHNVPAKVARKRDTRRLPLDLFEVAVKTTDFGRTFEHAVNDMTNWYEELKRGEISHVEIEDRIASLKDRYDRIAFILVNNNGLLEEWRRTGKSFIDGSGRIRTFKDAVKHMQEIMALGRKDGAAWDQYVVERHERSWVPVEYKWDKKNKTTIKQDVPPGDPKYEEYQRRLSDGTIIDPATIL
jgi:hypothetical protein